MAFVYPYRAVCTVIVRWNWNVIVMKDGLAQNVILVSYTVKSLSEVLIFGSINDKRLFIDLPVQYMKTTSSECVV